MKKVKAVLAKWSRESFGNIFQEIYTLEEIIKVREQQFEVSLSGAKREALFKAHAELNIQLRREKEFWKRKIDYNGIKMEK